MMKVTPQELEDRKSDLTFLLMGLFNRFFEQTGCMPVSISVHSVNVTAMGDPESHQVIADLSIEVRE